MRLVLDLLLINLGKGYRNRDSYYVTVKKGILYSIILKCVGVLSYQSGVVELERDVSMPEVPA